MSNRYITRVELKNFQGHVDSFVDFSQGVTSFVGESNTGKSTFVKAIEWVHSNKVAGDRPSIMIHHNSIRNTTKQGNVKITGDSIVKVFFSDSHIIEKIKGKDQIHNITYPDGKVVTLTATGQVVPDEVTKIFGFTDINHAVQSESFFILFDTPISIAKKLNEITDLTLGDKLLTKIKARTRALNSKKNVLDDDIIRISKELEAYKDLPLMEEELNALEELEELSHTLIRDIKSMDEDMKQYKEYEVLLDAYKDIPAHKKSLDELLKEAEKVKELRDVYIDVESYLKDMVYLLERKQALSLLTEQKKEIDQLLLDKADVNSVLSLVVDIQNSIDEIAKYEKRLEVDFKPVQFGKDLDVLIQVCKERDSLLTEYQESNKVLNEFLEVYNKKVTIAKTVELLQHELGDALKGACPLCGREG